MGRSRFTELSIPNGLAVETGLYDTFSGVLVRFLLDLLGLMEISRYLTILPRFIAGCSVNPGETARASGGVRGVPEGRADDRTGVKGEIGEMPCGRRNDYSAGVDESL